MTTPANTFLNTLWPDNVPDRACIQLWTLADKKTHSFQALDPAAERVTSVDGDIYIAAGLAPSVVKPSNTRTAARAIVGIPGIWADLDVNGGPEHKTGAAPDIDSAITLAKSIVPPTLLINSGYGLQAWWLLDKPWLFREGDNEQAARMVQAFQTMLRAKAKAAGFTIDSTHDLARLMRIPGSENCKGQSKGLGKAPVTILDQSDVRYSVTDIMDLVQGHLAEVVEHQNRMMGTDADFDLRSDGTYPVLKVDELKKISVPFARDWERDKGFSGRPRTRSANEWDMSIANHLAHAGFTDQEIADCLVYYRLRWGDDKGKAKRRSYIALTIAKAKMGAVDHDDLEEEAEQREFATEQLEAMADRKEADPLRAASLFSKVLGGPEVKRLIQDGMDPQNVQYRLELADGSDVHVGNASDLLNQAIVRSAFMVVTSHIIPQIKEDKWRKIIQALLNGATINAEDDRASIAHAWLEGYLEGMVSTDRDAACQAKDPFEHDDHIYVHVPSMNAWMRRQEGARMKDVQLQQYLGSAGFDRKTVSYTRDDGTPSSRSYWRCPKESLPWS